ncbi:winged helix-turn-helix transcriptional regulator [Elongatibacter sediminis]|uniref:Helix-turn-helix domain-containing protein n=1 Tax=Elongatibacter sediminis TaxID=3119006 RepID=A0AAW9RNL6_9GAMM
MAPQRRSDCPLAFALDAIGDRWSLLVLRDILLHGKRHYEEFLESGEGISTNILADRLKRLARQGLLSKERDADNRRRYIYRPTEKALDLLPVIVEMVLWSARYDPDTGVTPDVVERLRDDRAGFFVEVRRRFGRGEGA